MTRHNGTNGAREAEDTLMPKPSSDLHAFIKDHPELKGATALTIAEAALRSIHDSLQRRSARQRARQDQPPAGVDTSF